MKQIPIETSKKILKNKKELEEVLNVKINVKIKEVTIDGNPEDEFIAEKVIDAINFGFPLQVALLIKREELLFEVLNIKEYTPRKDFETIRARIIGREGRTLRTLANLTECYFELKDNRVAIIGSAELIKNAQDAVISLIKGSKQANVYASLEKHQIQPVLDLGLKKKKE